MASSRSSTVPRLYRRTTSTLAVWPIRWHLEIACFSSLSLANGSNSTTVLAMVSVKPEAATLAWSKKHRHSGSFANCPRAWSREAWVMPTVSFEKCVPAKRGPKAPSSASMAALCWENTMTLRPRPKLSSRMSASASSFDGSTPWEPPPVMAANADRSEAVRLG